MAMLSKHKSVRDALLYAANNDSWSGGNRVESPLWENVARGLYDMATNPSAQVVGSITRATRAQKIILDRTTGTRRAGSHPAQRSRQEISFPDLTGGGEIGR